MIAGEQNRKNKNNDYDEHKYDGLWKMWVIVSMIDYDILMFSAEKDLWQYDLLVSILIL